MRNKKPWDLSERTFLFACAIVRVCVELSREPGARRHLASQLLRAGTSIGANYEEAQAAYSRREFAAKTSIVLRECRETRYWLRLILANGLGMRESIDPLLAESNELVGIFSATVKRARTALVSTATLGLTLFSLLTFPFFLL